MAVDGQEVVNFPLALVLAGEGHGRDLLSRTEVTIDLILHVLFHLSYLGLKL